MKKWMLVLALAAAISGFSRIKLVEFKNDSDLKFNPTFCNGIPIEGALLDQPESCLATEDDKLMMIFEDAGRSGYHHPHWKFHVWLEKDSGFSLFNQNRILYAVIFYDGDGEISIYWDKDQKLHVRGSSGVKDILYPWAKGTIGRGNPYHEIQNTEIDRNGIKYFDYNGFVGYSSNLFVDP